MPTTAETAFSVLVVDDEPDARTILRAELEKLAGVTLKVATAADGDEALDKLNYTKPLRTLLGEKFVEAYRDVKYQEMQHFRKVISSWEREYLLLNV